MKREKRLTIEEGRRLRMWLQGSSYAAIAAELGVTRAAIHKQMPKLLAKICDDPDWADRRAMDLFVDDNRKELLSVLASMMYIEGGRRSGMVRRRAKHEA